MHCEKYWDEEMQHYKDEENRSINTIENQLVEFCQQHQEKFTQLKNACIAPNSNENLENWGRIITLIVGDSMPPDNEERRISKTDRKFKVKYFPSETFDGMHDYINR